MEMGGSIRRRAYHSAIMGVDRCICHNVTFSRLKDECLRVGSDLESLARATGCTTNCGMCKPYVLLMLESGRTVFPVLSQPMADQILAKWAATKQEPPRKPLQAHAAES